MLRTCTSSTDDALMTLDAYKAAAKIVTTSDDAIIQSALQRATSLIEAYVGYPLRRQVYNETVPSYGGLELQVSRLPIQSIEAIYMSTEPVDPASYEISSPGSGLIYRESGWPWMTNLVYDLMPHPMPQGEPRLFRVVYEAGFSVSGSTGSQWLTSGDAVPGSVEAAMMLTTNYLYRAAGNDPSVVQRKIGDLMITYKGFTAQSQAGSFGLPEDAKAYVAHLVRV